jgi:succinate-acetate transporter protein
MRIKRDETWSDKRETLPFLLVFLTLFIFFIFFLTLHENKKFDVCYFKLYLCNILTMRGMCEMFCRYSALLFIIITTVGEEQKVKTKFRSTI